MDDKKFAEELGKIFNDLASKQEPLEPEFQKIWDDNYEELLDKSNEDDKE